MNQARETSSSGRTAGNAHVVVVGAGQGGLQVASSLRDQGFAGAITLVGDEPYLPYPRPPLSKGFLKARLPAEDLAFRPQQYFRQQGVQVRLGEKVVGVDRRARHVTLSKGEQLDYTHLVLATGARPRPLQCEGARLQGVHMLRTVADATVLRGLLKPGARLLVVGGGFVGLEVAAAAAEAGCHVTVVELSQRLMARAVPPRVSAYFLKLHQSRGVEVLTGQSLAALKGNEGTASHALLADGTRIECDLVLAGIGVTPNCGLAREASIAADDGFTVNQALQSVSDPNVFAIGDCARFPATYALGGIRLESVQNVLDQARTVARSIASGVAVPYRALPWFWTEQFGSRLQMAGWTPGHDASLLVGDEASGQFSIEYYRKDQLVAVDSVNHTSHYLATRKKLEAHFVPTLAADSLPARSPATSHLNA